MQNQVLMIFCKYPTPGEVKTRLAKDVGTEKATELYKSFVESIVKNTESAYYQQVIFYWPPNKKQEMTDWLQKEEALHLQEGDHLGQRMRNAFEKVFSLGAQKIIVIGTDSPFINEKTILDAFEDLDNHDCVLGPSTDGGYYLLGLKQPQNHLFKGIRWGTGAVLNQTIQRATEKDLKIFLLPKGYDIDTVDDLNHLLDFKRN